MPFRYPGVGHEAARISRCARLALRGIIQHMRKAGSLWFPTGIELAEWCVNNAEESRQVLHAAASTGEIGRSILTTPGVPPERIVALRTAFQAMLNDPDFLATCEKRKLMIDGATGEEIDEIIHATLWLPKAVAEKIGQLMQ
jgi:hypothetical protein